MTTTILGSDSPVAREFRVGEVLSKTFNVFVQNFGLVVVLFGIALAPMIPLYVQIARNPDDVFGAVVIELAYDRLVTTVCQSLVIYAAFQQMRDRRAGIGESISKAAGALPAAVATGVIVTVLWVIGTLLLVIPGIIVATMLAVALPVCVVERVGPLRSLSRSAELTKGFRMSIFGAFIGLGVVNMIVSLIIAAVGRETVMVNALMTYAWSLLLAGYTAVLSTIIYHDLRMATEGIDSDQIAAVFD